MAITKVSGGILDPGINVAGIVTATGFDGPFTGGSTKNITAGIITATGLDINGNGDISGNLVVGGNLTANGDFTTLNTTLREVELLRVDANSSTVAGIITQRGSGDILNLYDGSTEVFSVEDGGDVIAGVGDLAIHTGSRRRLVITDTANGALLHIRGQSPAVFFDQSGGNIGKIYQDNADLGIYAGRPDSEGTNTVRITSTGAVVTGILTATSFVGALPISNDGNDRVITATGTTGTLNAESNFTYNGTQVDITGTTDGVLNLDTTDGRGSFIRFKQGGTTKVWVGCSEGIGTGGDQDDLGLRATDNIIMRTGSAVSLLIDSNGVICVNHTNALHSGNLQVSAAGGDAIDINSYSTNTNNGGRLSFYRSKNATIGSNTIVADGDSLGRIDFRGYNTNGNSYDIGATIEARVDGSVNSSTDMPTAILFKTSNDGSASPDERLRIASDGKVGIGTNNPGATLTVQSDSSNTSLTGHNYLASQSGIILQNRTISSGHFTAYTGNVRSSGGYTQSGSLAFEATGSGTTPNIHITQRTGSGVQSKRLTVDTSGHILPGASGTQNLGSTTLEWGNVYIADSKNIFFGNEQDAEIYHNGSSGLYMNNSTGNTYIRSGGGQVLIRPSNSYDAIVAKTNEVELYYNQQNHSTPKLKTSATGITVDGEVAATQDYPLSRPTLDLNFAAQKKLDPRITYQRTGPASFTDKFGKVVLVGDNAPRFDHDPDTGECKGLLIEESRTNVAPYTDLSEYGGYNFTSTANDAVAPDGTTTATKIEHGGSGTSYLDHINTSVSAQNAGNYTYSVWLKAPDDQPDGYYGCRIAVLHSTGGNVEPTVSLNKTWTRYSVTKNFGASDGGNLRVHLVMFRASPGGTYDGKVIPSYVWAWGAQIEQGAFPTSYIPTAGATRGKDLVEITGEEFSEFYNRTEGSFVSEIMLKPSFPVTGYASVVMSLSDSSYDNRVTLSSSTGSAAFNADVTIGGTQNRAVIGSYTSGSYSIKAAMAYKQADSAGSLNGAAAVTTSPSPGTLPLLTRADIGKDHGNFNPLNGHIKRIMYYSKRLSNNQLRTLTS